MTQFAEAMFDILTSIFETFFKILVEGLSLIFGGNTKKGYNASFASERTILSRWWKYGFCLTGIKRISEHDSFMNCLVSAPSGAGKTQTVILPSLLSMRGSFVVNDASGENFQATSGPLAAKGHNVMVLNFAKPEISAGYNPIPLANTSSAINKIASLLVRTANAGGKATDPFWESQAISIIVVLISLLKTQAEQYQNFTNVRHLLNHLGREMPEGETNPIDTLFARYANPVLFAEYRAIVSLDSKLLSSIIASAKSALTLFADESVARVTATNTIDFSELRKHPTVLYIQSSIADMKYYSVLISMFMEQFIGYVLSRFPEKGEQNIFLLIDEFSSLRVPVFPSAFANVRKHNCGILAVIQDYNQLVNAYGKADAESIRSNCWAKVQFAGASNESARELSEMLGKMTYTDEDGKKQVRPLLTNDEIRMLRKNRCLLICGANPPVLARSRPAYQSRRYRTYMAVQPPKLKGSVPETVALLPLDDPDA